MGRLCAIEWVKLSICHLKRKPISGNWQMDRILIILKKSPQGFIWSLITGAIFHNIQTCLLVYTADLRGAFTGPLVLLFTSQRSNYSEYCATPKNQHYIPTPHMQIWSAKQIGFQQHSPLKPSIVLPHSRRLS